MAIDHIIICNNVHSVNKQLPNKILHTSTKISKYYPCLQLTSFWWPIKFARSELQGWIGCVMGKRAFSSVWFEGLKLNAGDKLPSLPVFSCMSWAGPLLSPSVSNPCLVGDRLGESRRAVGVLLLPLLWRRCFEHVILDWIISRAAIC
mgnify:FL=1